MKHFLLVVASVSGLVLGSNLYAQSNENESVANDYKFCVVTHRESHTLKRSQTLEHFWEKGGRTRSEYHSYSLYTFEGNELVPIGFIDKFSRAPGVMCFVTQSATLNLVVQEHSVKKERFSSGAIRSPQVTPFGLRTRYNYFGRRPNGLSLDDGENYGVLANFDRLGSLSAGKINLDKQTVATTMIGRQRKAGSQKITTEMKTFFLQPNELCQVGPGEALKESHKTKSTERHLELIELFQHCEMMEMVAHADFEPVNTVIPKGKRLNRILSKMKKHLTLN